MDVFNTSVQNIDALTTAGVFKGIVMLFGATPRFHYMVCQLFKSAPVPINQIWMSSHMPVSKHACNYWANY
jgi:hypothetical protein